jgi:hypothetical protein
MKILLMGFGAFLFTFTGSGAAFGYDLVCEDTYNTYVLTVHFNDAIHNGENKADSAELKMHGYNYGTFSDCVLNKGSRIVLHCGSSRDWEVNITLNNVFDPGNLTRYNRIAGTLVCKP